MRRYSFGSYAVHEGNEAAFTACQAVARFTSTDAMPLVLVGREGAGKTHLLYAIVNRVKSAKSRAGLAYITANQFPGEVKALISDPSPLDRVDAGVLLVDELDAFTTSVEDLEAVVRLFLDHGKSVVMASAAPLDELTHLPERLRELIGRGTIIDVASTDSGREDVAKLRAERDRLASEVAELQTELEESATLRDELDAATAELTSTRMELERVKAESAEATSDASEKAELANELERAKARADTSEEQVHALSDALDRAVAEQMRLQERLEAQPDGSDALFAKLKAANEEIERLRAGAPKDGYAGDTGEAEVLREQLARETAAKEDAFAQMAVVQKAYESLLQRHCEVDTRLRILAGQLDEAAAIANGTLEFVQPPERIGDVAQEDQFPEEGQAADPATHVARDTSQERPGLGVHHVESLGNMGFSLFAEGEPPPPGDERPEDNRAQSG